MNHKNTSGGAPVWAPKLFKAFVATINRAKDKLDGLHRAENQLNRVLNVSYREQSVIVGAMLWEATRQDLIATSGSWIFWDRMANAKGHFDTEDFLALMAALTFDDEPWSTNSYNMPGWEGHLEEMLIVLIEAGDTAGLVEGWGALEEPIRSTVALGLGRHRLLTWEAMPEGVLPKAAQLYLCNYDYKTDYDACAGLWPDEMWHSAVQKAGAQLGASIEGWPERGLPEHLVGADLDTVVKHILNVNRRGIGLAIQALDPLGEAVVPVIEGVLRAYDAHEDHQGLSERGTIAICALARAVHAHGGSIDSDFEARLNQAIDHKEIAPQLRGALIPFLEPDQIIALACHAAPVWGVERLSALGEIIEAPLERIADKLALPGAKDERYSTATVVCGLGLIKAARGDALGPIHIPLLDEAVKNKDLKDTLDPIVSALPIEAREALLTSDEESWRRHWGLCPTPKVIEHTLAFILPLPAWRLNHLDEIMRANFAAFGPVSLPHLEASYGRANHGVRACLIRYMGTIDDPKAVESLFVALCDKNDNNRSRAIDFLKTHSLDELREPLLRHLSSRKKDQRFGAVQLLMSLDIDSELLAAAQKALKKERVARIKEMLQKLTVSDEGDLADRAEAFKKGIDPAIRRAILDDLGEPDPDHDKIGRSTITSAVGDGSGWTKHKDKGLAVLAVTIEWLAGRLRHFGEDKLLINIEGLIDHFDADPLAPWIAVELALTATGYESTAINYMTRCYGRFGPAGIAPIKALLTKGTRRDSVLFHTLASTDPLHVVDLLCEGLAHKTKSIRDTCVGGLIKAGAPALPALYPLLGARRKDTRLAVAAALAGQKNATSLPHLDKALSAESRDDVKEALHVAIDAVLTQVRSPLPDIADTKASDATLGTWMADHRLPRPPEYISLDSLPAMHFVTGKPLPDGAVHWLVAKLRHEDPEHPDDQLAPVRARLDDTACADFGAAIWRMFSANPDWDERPWLARLPKWTGSQAQVLEHAPDLGDRWNFGPLHRDDLLELLVHFGSDEGVGWLVFWLTNTDYDYLRNKIDAALKRIAAARAIPLGALMESALPTFGFDASVRRPFAFGSRALTLTLDQDLKPIVLNEKGRALKSLPSPRKGDDAQAISAARADYKALQTRLARFAGTIRDRLEATMISGRTWDAHRFSSLFLAHPIMQPIARGLVFEVHTDTGHQLITLPSETTGHAIDLHGEPASIPEGSTVSLPHPVRLAPEDIEAWQDALFVPGFTQPFMQLFRHRAPFTPAETPEATFSDLFPRLTSLPKQAFVRLKRKFGYHDGEGGNIVESIRQVGGFEWTLEHTHHPINSSHIDPDETLDITRIDLNGPDGPMLWEEAPTAVLSEIGWDLERFARLRDTVAGVT